MTKPVLVTVHIDTHFVELSRVMRLLKQSGRYDSLLWFKYPYDMLERDLAICRAEGWRYLAPPAPTKPGQKQDEQRLLRLLFNKLPAILRFFLRLFRSLREYRRQAREMGELLEQHKPSLLIMAEDSIEYHLYILIKVGRARGIPTVIIPFTIANSSEPAEHYFDQTEYIVSDSLVNRLVGSRYPRWIYPYKGRNLLRLPAGNIFALELLGFAPRRPWTYNSEETSFIAVENEFMFQYYRKENLPAARMTVTGALYDDVLAKNRQDTEVLRETLYQEINLPSNRPLLLCALPPSQFPRLCEFENYEDLVRFWMETLAAITAWNVVVRPHPRLTEKEIESLKRFGVGITQRDTASLIPLCDLYVASVSATIRWAIACGKPVVNYDVYRMDYADYEEAKGVITMDDKASFVAALRRLTTEPGDYARINTLQREGMTQWGKLDGKSGERMLQLFDNVIRTGGK
jgi:hypothetical protein